MVKVRYGVEADDAIGELVVLQPRDRRDYVRTLHKQDLEYLLCRVVALLKAQSAGKLDELEKLKLNLRCYRSQMSEMYKDVAVSDEIKKANRHRLLAICDMLDLFNKEFEDYLYPHS